MDNKAKDNQKFMNLPQENSNKDNSQVVIIPICYEQNISAISGANKAPQDIIDSSYELEYYDCELDCEPYQKGIYTDDLFISNDNNYSKVTNEINNKCFNFINKDKFPIVIGGDHSITLGVIEAFDKKNSDFGIVVFDAHSDLREEWGEDTWYHACVSRSISKKHKTLICGVRSQDYYEKEYLDSNTNESNNIYIIKSNELLNSNNSFDLKNCKVFDEKLDKLPKNIYISIDVDVFDPSFIRYTGTPQPGGLNWTQLNNLLKKIFKTKNVIGCDIVEFSPGTNKKDYFCESFSLAKLIYKIIGYKYYIDNL